MNYEDSMQRLVVYRNRISELRNEMRAIQASAEPQEVNDYIFEARNGEVRLSELFSEQEDLVIVHNMGKSCPYCTLWADGYNGIYPHLANRAAFIVTSPDAPDVQRAFAEERGWRFPMVSHRGSTFAEDMGYCVDDRYLPGLSVFRVDDRRLVRVSDSGSRPRDDYCALWHIFDLLPEGPAGWQPQMQY